jgi:type I restriction enzyme R subunit
MTRGLKVAGGDRLGKTIIFAKNQAHAEFIAGALQSNYPHYRGEFARSITFKTEYAQSLIDRFSQKDKAPHIAISVDMLDTGIDMPEVVNLVFFKLVRSKTKFWQMLGRGTRLCPDLFGPGRTRSSSTSSTTARTWSSSARTRRRPKARSANRWASACSRRGCGCPSASEAKARRPDEAELRRETAESLLHDEVAAMNVDNFVVRPQRRLVEKYAKPEAWGD